MAVSPNVASDGPVRVTITSGGQAIPDSIEVFGVEVLHAIGRISSASIVVGDGDMPSNRWEVADSTTFLPGKEISIKAGYGDDEDVIFKGIVVKLGAQITEDNASRLHVYCQDKAVSMTFGRHNANHIDKTDSDIIKSLIGAHGLSADVDSTSVKYRELVQYYSCDWDFMMTRAEVNGLMVVVDAGKVSVKAPATSGDPALEVTWGIDLFDFQADLDARDQVETVNTVAWDPKNQAIVQGSARVQSLNRQGNLDSGKLASLLGKTPLGFQSASVLESAALKAWAQAQQVKAGLARIQGHMSFRGSAKAEVGTLIKLAGVGERYNGNVFVGGLAHEISEGEWRTRADFGLPSHWFAERADVVAPPAAGWVPGAAGLQVGVVMKLDADPAGEHRVQVEIPLLQAKNKGVWARLLQYHASKEFGAFYVPEIGDEVVIGYFNDDPSNPVILGSLYSSNRAPPYAIEAENNIKAIVTRSKARIEIDDKDVIVTIKTPAKNTVVIDDKNKSILLKDQHGNSLKLDESGITLDSIKDITMSALGNINATAKKSIAVTATGDLTAVGLNTTIEAKASITCKGTASAEFSASGQTTVRGAMVLIN